MLKQHKTLSPKHKTNCGYALEPLQYLFFSNEIFNFTGEKYLDYIASASLRNALNQLSYCVILEIRKHVHAINIFFQRYKMKISMEKTLKLLIY